MFVQKELVLVYRILAVQSCDVRNKFDLIEEELANKFPTCIIHPTDVKEYREPSKNPEKDKKDGKLVLYRGEIPYLLGWEKSYTLANTGLNEFCYPLDVNETLKNKAICGKVCSNED